MVSTSPKIVKARSRAAWRQCLVGAVVSALVLGVAFSARAEDRPAFSRQELEPLLALLQRDGFGRDTLTRVFYERDLRRVPLAISLNTLTRETDELYQGFLTPYAINKARRFRRRHFGLLLEAEQRYGVNRDVITAILLVETQFGTYPLRFRILEVFTTLALQGHPRAVHDQYARLKPEHPDLSLDYLAERLLQKSEWAYSQLVALLDFPTGQRHPHDIRGSYAGAIGIPQFLPTSYQRWAVDGDGDGSVNLDELPDAVHSIGNYLRAHGWRDDAGYAARRKAVWEYNHSEPYVDTIFAVSRLLNVPGRKPRDMAPVMPRRPYKASTAALEEEATPGHADSVQ